MSVKLRALGFIEKLASYMVLTLVIRKPIGESAKSIFPSKKYIENERK